MKENAPGEIRFCDEYERLLEELLQSLARWKQVAASDRCEKQEKKPSEIELMLAKRGYVWAMVTLQEHSRECLLCEETLRAYVNVTDRSASTAGSSLS